MNDIELMHYAVAKSLTEIREHKKSIEHLKSFVEAVAEADCYNNDGCPEYTMNRRYRCTPCKARICLEELKDLHATPRDCNPS